MHKEFIKNTIEESINLKSLFLKSENIEKINRVCNKIIEAYRNRNKLIIFGNGGSAADAQHFVAELVGRFKKNRQGLPAIALHTNTSTLTALANDFSYDDVFAHQVQALANKNDILVGISTSGNSINVIKALKKGKDKECLLIGLTGKDGGKIKDIVDININVESNDTPRIQELHIMIIHIICEIVENELFK